MFNLQKPTVYSDYNIGNLLTLVDLVKASANPLASYLMTNDPPLQVITDLLKPAFAQPALPEVVTMLRQLSRRAVAVYLVDSCEVNRINAWIFYALGTYFAGDVPSDNGFEDLCQAERADL